LLQLPDYYAALGIEPDAHRSDIRAAYCRLARRYDPGLVADPVKEAIMIGLNQAHEVLTVPWKRAFYDLFPRQAAARPGIEASVTPGGTKVPATVKWILIGLSVLFLFSVVTFRWNVAAGLLAFGLGTLAAMTILVNILIPDVDPDRLEDIQDGA
jgi:curved DNA-binding protein CbpA